MGMTHAVQMPLSLWEPLAAFAGDYGRRAAEGKAVLSQSRVAIVGLARNCAAQLANNLLRLEQFAGACGSWQLHIEANDCDDDTVPVLMDFYKRHPQATFHYQVLGRGQYAAEFAGRRTIAMAEYRDACQRWARACAADSDYVVVIDWDQWGGWSHAGLLNGIGWLAETPDAYGMSSVSMFQYDFGNGPQWAHYDLWALRGVGQSDCYWDAYTNACGGWGYGWLPPVGSPPVLVSSAFGGLCVYRTNAYLAGVYDGREDCEHVPFHRSIATATGQHLYLCPAMRTIMTWMEPSDAGHGLDGV